MVTYWRGETKKLKIGEIALNLAPKKKRKLILKKKNHECKKPTTSHYVPLHISLKTIRKRNRRQRSPWVTTGKTNSVNPQEFPSFLTFGNLTNTFIHEKSLLLYLITTDFRYNAPSYSSKTTEGDNKNLKKSFSSFSQKAKAYFTKVRISFCFPFSNYLSSYYVLKHCAGCSFPSCGPLFRKLMI